MRVLVLVILFGLSVFHGVLLWDTFYRARDPRFWIWALTKTLLLLLIANTFFPVILFSNGQSLILIVLSLVLSLGASIPLHKIRKTLTKE